MLSKRHRLSRRDFVYTKTHGKSFSALHFTAIVNKSAANNQGPLRFSVVISTKIHKLATVRNRLRRQIYESLRLSNFNRKADIIIFPKPGMLNLKYEKIYSEVNTFLSKISS